VFDLPVEVGEFPILVQQTEGIDHHLRTHTIGHNPDLLRLHITHYQLQGAGASSAPEAFATCRARR
jgi:hypothetical protein